MHLTALSSFALRLAGVLPLALACAALSGQPLDIIELRNRPAEQILPVLAPLLAAGGTATGSGFQLFVRTTPANLAQIRRVVANLDRAPRQLMITVRQDSGAASAGSGVGVRGTTAPGAAAVRAGAYDRTGTAQDNVAQRLRVQEGSAAYIGAGTSTLVPLATVTRTVNGVVVHEAALQRDLDTGFSVTPRVNGDTVFLDIGTRRDAPAAGSGADAGRGAASINRSASTVSGRLGEWIELAGQNLAQSAETRGLMARSSDAGAQERRVWVMVEEVR